MCGHSAGHITFHDSNDLFLRENSVVTWQNIGSTLKLRKEQQNYVSQIFVRYLLKKEEN